MNRRVTIQTPLGDSLQFRKLVGREALSQLYAFDIELMGNSNALDAKALLGKASTVAVETESGGVRYLAGIATRFGLEQEDARHSFYKLRLRPWLWLATRRSDFRIFQDKTVPEILADVLGTYGYPMEQKLGRGDYRRWDYCVQYHESDFDFVSRLCELEGIYYHFRHEQSQHVLVFADDIAGSHTPLPEGEEVRYHPLEKSGMGQRERIYAWEIAEEVRPGHHYNDDYDFQKPKAELSHLRQTPPGHDHDSYEQYEWPGGFVQHGDGETYARIRNEEQLSQRNRATGRANLRTLATGHTLRLTGHPKADQNQQYLLLSVSYHLQENLQASEGAEPAMGTEGSVQRFAFEVQPTTYAWRPRRTTDKPRTRGPQTAMVVGPAGEEIWTDQYGRIKVQFHWDRIGQHNENSSCWVRVSTAWAGATFGMTSVPRIGMEVIVDFLNGDPDYPIVTGCVHNADTMPAWQLPEQKHLSGIRSRELGGGRGNHLVLDDTNGKIQAQLRSDHQASQLSVGHIGRIEDTAGRKEPRGQGFELRTDGHGVLRAAKGLLVSTEARANAQAHITDMAETVGRLTQARDLHEGLGEVARGAQAHDAGDQDEVTQVLKEQNDAIKGQQGGNRGQGEFPEFQEPHLTLASARGLQTVAQGSTHVVSSEHTALTSGGHTSVSAGKSLLVSVQSAIRLFAAKAGMRLVAASADIDIKALKDSVNVLAKLNITQTANKITIHAKEEVVINGGSSYSRWSSGGIEHGTSGIWREHAAVHSLVGPASQGKPALPNPPQVPKGQLDLYHQYIKPTGEKHQGVAQGDFSVVDSEGGTHAGTFDRNGFATVSGLPIGTAKVSFGKDPRDPWEEGSYFGTPKDWKAKAPTAAAADAGIGGAGGLSGLAGSAGGAAGALAGVAGAGGKTAGALGQVAQAAGMAQQAVGAAQAIQQGGAKALLGQASQAATGMAMQAAGARLGPVGSAAANVAGSVVNGGGVGGVVGGLSGAVPAGMKTGVATAAANPALQGRTPGFNG